MYDAAMASQPTPQVGPWRLRMSAFLFAALVSFAANAQPAAPDDFVATAGDKEAGLTWRDPSNPDVAGYEFRFHAGDMFNAWAAVPGGGASTVEHTVSGLANGTRYFFELRAFDDNGPGAAARMSTRLAESPSSTVEVPDEELRTSIRRRLRMASGAPITQGAMARLRWMRWDLDGDGAPTGAREAGIADLTGLEFAINLEALSLWANEIADVSPLSGLTALRELYLGGNAITDVSLSGLTELIRLDLSSNEISDVSLSGLASLVDLYLLDNAIEYISFSGLTALAYLNLNDNEIVDVSSLSGMTLFKLSLSNNKIADLSPLSDLRTLELFLSNNKIADVSPLSGMKGLELLDLSNNKIVNVSPLSRLTWLGTLDLSGNEIEDIPLSSMTGLRYLNLSYNEIADVAPLSGLTALTWLDLAGNEMVDVSLSDLPELRWLTLSNNQNDQIESILLSGMTALEFPDLSSLTSLTRS